MEPIPENTSLRPRKFHQSTYIESEIWNLQHLITSIEALSRRPLNDITDLKVKVVVLKDFTAYGEDVLREVEGRGGVYLVSHFTISMVVSFLNEGSSNISG